MRFFKIWCKSTYFNRFRNFFYDFFRIKKVDLQLQADYKFIDLTF